MTSMASVMVNNLPEWPNKCQSLAQAHRRANFWHVFRKYSKTTANKCKQNNLRSLSWWDFVDDFGDHDEITLAEKKTGWFLIGADDDDDNFGWISWRIGFRQNIPWMKKMPFLNRLLFFLGRVIFFKMSHFALLFF